MALMCSPMEDLIKDHDGVEALTFVLRQRLFPPPSSVVWTFGSRMKGAMKFAVLPLPASGIPEYM